MNLYVGVDISKGYADFCVTDGEGIVREEHRLDDTRSGHDQAQELAREWNGTVSDDEELLVGMEATGGLERNWLHLFEQIADETELEVYCINPLILRRFAEQRLHAGKTDRISAQLMAEHLRFGGVKTDSEGDGKSPHPGLRTLSRKTKELIGRATELKNELHALLQRVHPELAQHVRGHMSQWVLKLIEQYPTPEEVVEAGTEAVAEIPYVTEERAREVVEDARSSVAGQTDPDTGLALSMVAEDLLRLTRRIDRLKDRLWNRVKDRTAPRITAPRILRSIDGIGKWGAAVLYIEIGDITRFDSVEKLVAYAGLDPQVEQSGDRVCEKGISKKGNRYIRAVLYACVTAAIRSRNNPPVRRLFDRLKAKGKHQKVAEVACMRKLLAIVYGCWSNGERFDPQYEERLKARQERKAQDGQTDSGQETSEGKDLSAPVSQREATRRKKAPMPQKSSSSSDRGQEAFQ
jgi:transposase